MKTWFKRIAIGLVIGVLVAVVGLGIFLLTFDPNAYKDKLAEIVHERYQRTLVIDGAIELSLFPRIGLSVQGISLSEMDSPEIFASIDSARLAVAIWPLLSNQLVIDHVGITGFSARLRRAEDGHFNFENLVGAAVAPDAEALPVAMPVADTRQNMQIDIAGLDLKNGKILLQDDTRRMAVAITNLNANTSRVTFNKPFDVSMSARVEGGYPRFDAGLTGSALLTLDPSARRYAAQKLDLRMEGKLPGAQARNLAVRGNLAFNGATASLDVAGLEVLFQGDITDPHAAMSNVEGSVAVPRLVLDQHKKQLQIEKLAVRAKGMLDSGLFEVAADAPALNISPESASGDTLSGRLRYSGMDASVGLTGISGNAAELDITQAKLDVAVTRGARLMKLAFVSPLSLNLLEQRVAMEALKGDVNITDPDLPKGALQIPVIGSISADLLKDQASAKVNAVLEGGKFDLSAELTQLRDLPTVSFALAVDTLDLDKLAPAATAMSAPPPASDAKPADGKPAVEAVASEPEALDLSALVGPRAEGTLSVGHLVLRGLHADNVSAKLNLDKGLLKVTALNAGLYGGKLDGALSVDAAKDNRIASRLSLSGIAMEPLLSDLTQRQTLSGVGSLLLDIKTEGANTYAMQRALSGTVQLHLRDGAVRGLNMVQTLLELKAAFRGEARDEVLAADATRQTGFAEFEADVALAQGVGTVKRLSLVAPLLRISQGEPATLDVVSRSLDLLLKVRVVNTTTGQDGRALAPLRNVTVPLLVSGPLDALSYTVKWREVATAALRGALKNKVQQAVGGRTSGQDVGRAIKDLLR